MGLPNINNKGTRKGKTPLTLSIVEVTNEEEESPQTVKDIYDDLFGDHNLDGEIAESAGLEDQVSAIQVDEYGCGTYDVFDDHYDPRQVNSTNNRIHTNDLNAKQHDQYVAYHSSKLRIGDVYNKVLSSQSTVHCAQCASCENNIRVIADTGASDHFTYDKSDL